MQYKYVVFRKYFIDFALLIIHTEIKHVELPWACCNGFQMRSFSSEPVNHAVLSDISVSGEQEESSALSEEGKHVVEAASENGQESGKRTQRRY